MKKISLLIAIMVIVFAFRATAEDLPKLNIKSLDDKVQVDKNIRVGKLDNGLSYYIRKNSKPENFAKFRLVVKTGAIQEDDDQTGLAHFIEHMAFNGTKNFPKNELVDFLQKAGMRFGPEINASTSMEQTLYELPVFLKDQAFLESAFQILQDWAGNMTLANDMIDGERGVIMSEWRQRFSSQRRLYDAHSPIIFKDSKYAKRNIIGDTAILQNFKYDVIKRYYKDWYRPDLMAIVAVGDFDVDKIESMIKKSFSVLKNPANERPNVLPEMPYQKDLLISIAKDKEMPMEQAAVYFKLPKFETETYNGYKESIKRSLYDIMFSNRLTEFQTKPNPPFVYAGGGEGSFYGEKRSYNLQCAAKEGGLKNALDVMLTEAVRVKHFGFTKTEFDRAKVDLLSNLEKAYNERHTRLSDSYVEEYTNNFTDGDPIPGIETELAFVKQLFTEMTLQEVSDLAKLYIKPENCVITASLPDKAGYTAPTESDLKTIFVSSLSKKLEPYVDNTTDKPLFSKSLKKGSIVSETKNDKLGITELKLSNGAKVILKKTDFKDGEILFDAFSPGGLSLASDQDYISATVASNIVTEAGVDEFDQNTLTKLLTGKQIQLWPSIDDLYEGFRGKTVKGDLETFMQLLHLNFLYPRKDKESFNSVMDRLKPILANRSAVGKDVMADTINAILGQYNMRSMPLTVDKLSQVDIDKAYKFYNERFSDASGFTFVVVGDFDLNEMKGLLEKYIGSLPSKGGKENWKDLGIRYPNKAINKTITMGTGDRSVVRLMIPGKFDWTMQNRYNLNALLEMVDIKITEIVREEKSGIYSPDVYVSIDKYPSSEYCVIIEFVTKPNRVDELTNVIVKIMEDMKKTIDPDDVEKVRKSQQQQRPINLKNNNYWMNMMSSLQKNNEDMEYILNYDKLTDKLNAEDMLNTAKKYLNTKNLIKVVLNPATSK
ncbi:MAG: insulinase family protein [bacterium]